VLVQGLLGERLAVCVREAVAHTLRALVHTAEHCAVQQVCSRRLEPS